MPKTKLCKWTEDSDGNWDTACDDKFIFITGGPTENSMKFCPYCGKPIKVVPFEADHDATE